MRFIGSKVLLLHEIQNLINENILDNNVEVFCDIFGGTAVVSNFFKEKYTIISNDLLYFSYVIQNAIIKNNKNPTFLKLKSQNIDVFEYFNNINKENLDKTFENFIYKNYSPNNKSNRLYLSNENALKIDFFRNTIEIWKNNNLLNEEEYYLLASLIYSVPSVSNIAGTYGTYLKYWDKRALKKINFKKITIINNKMKNKCFNEDANILIKKIKGDIIYIDPPYNQRQYISNYHLLETIAKYDNPKINGITGVRSYNNEKSKYCFKKKEVIKEFTELIENANFKYIIVSYSSEGIMKEEEVKEILLKMGLNHLLKLKK